MFAVGRFPSVGIGLVVIATGRYRRFLPGLVASAEVHVAGLDRIVALVDDVRSVPRSPVVTALPFEHRPWPYPTLLRYRAMDDHRQLLGETDHLVYIDVDMRFASSFVSPVERGVFAVQHPYFVDAPPSELPYERDPASRAFVATGDGERYVAGGVQGGRSTDYLDAITEMAGWIDGEMVAGRTPIWHDESIWNRWCIEHPPAVVLDERYCWPEERTDGSPVIVALQKRHDYYRASTRRAAAAAVARPLLAATRRRLRSVGRRGARNA